MDNEEAFQRALDEKPDDHFLRMVFADYLDEIGDPRGPGYRALGETMTWPTEVHDGDGKWWYSHGVRKGRHWGLGKVWFEKIQHKHKTEEFLPYYANPYVKMSRREVDDEVTIAFSRLTPKQQREVIKRGKKQSSRPATAT